LDIIETFCTHFWVINGVNGVGWRALLTHKALVNGGGNTVGFPEYIGRLNAHKLCNNSYMIGLVIGVVSAEIRGFNYLSTP
jgi:hypothetical protein